MIESCILEGEYVRLEPLSLSHIDALCEVGLDDTIWQWSPHPIRSPDAMRTYVEAALEGQQQGHMLPFATVECTRDRVVGSTRFGAIDMADRRLEIGWTWIAPPWQRTAVNTEAKRLMLRHAFEVLHCHRVEFKTDRLNERSRAAIQRLGAVQEGIFRKHMVTASGRLRDSVYFSIIDDEWPRVESRLTAKLEQHGR